MQLDLSDVIIAAGTPIDITDLIIKHADHLGAGSIVLEAGCGTGKLGMNIAARTLCTAVLLDYDAEAVARATRFAHAVDSLFGERLPVVVRRGDILNMPFGEDTFDLVFNEGVIEHFLDPVVPLKAMVRVSRNTVSCLVPSALNKKQMDQARIQQEAHSGTDHWAAYEKPMTTDEIKGYFEQAGLKDVWTTLEWPEPNPPKSRSDYRMVFATGRKR